MSAWARACVRCQGWVVAPVGVTGLCVCGRRAEYLRRLAEQRHVGLVIWIVEDEQVVDRCTVADLVAANVEDEQVVEWVLGARPGSILVVGGGAQPVVELQCHEG